MTTPHHTAALSDEEERAAFDELARSILRLTNYPCPTRKSEINQLAQQAGKLAAHYLSRAHERSRQSALPVESGKVAGDRALLDAAMMIRKLAHRLTLWDKGAQLSEGSKLMAKQAVDFLKRHGLQGDMLREDAAHPQPYSEEPSEQDIERVARVIYAESELNKNQSYRTAKLTILSYLKKD